MELIELGEKIRRALVMRKLSYDDVGVALGIHLTAVGFWCRGITLPTQENQEKLVAFLKKTDKKSSKRPICYLSLRDFKEFN